MFYKKNPMFNLNEIATHLKAIPLSEQQAIVSLIDLKIEVEMNAVLKQLELMNKTIEMQQKENQKAISSLKWYIGLTVSIVGVLATVASIYFSH